MKAESRRFIHMGINYVTLPNPQIDQQASLTFQSALLSAGIDFTTIELSENQIKVLRKSPLPIEIRVMTKATQPKSFGQILVLAPDPYRALNNYSSEVEAVLEAFAQAWPAPNRQILSCDVTLRCLYPSTSEHAFQELWEQRLHRPQSSLARLGRPVLGGGLRFVMPPQAGEPEPTQIEVKIESFLQDAKKIFIETRFLWPEARPVGTPFGATARLEQVNAYILNEVQAFMTDDT
ncbi:MAG: hypothetical protein JXA89_00845 [Anaerolineae bacterium]|nr:hypothetical protein [Anaerolineae bacterium]